MILKKYTFSGGVHPPENKITEGTPLESIPVPEKVAIPVSQHIGAPAIPTVSPGDEVFVGSEIATAGDGLSLPVHSSVSGKVTAIEKRVNNFGRRIEYIIIESDGKQTISPNLKPFEGNINELSSKDAADILKNAGICGMGGATFPSYAKYLSAIGKVDRLIINCSECEPYITVNHRLMLERTDELIYGIKLLLSLIKVKSADIAIESNKQDAINLLLEKAENDEMINIRVMKTKYPEGDERQLIYALTGRQIPPGKLPADVGCVVFNTETVYSIYRAFLTGMPLVERMVTVSGDCIKDPKNLIVPIGTSYEYLVEYCGGFSSEPDEIISGGPMMGRAESDTSAVVTKGTSAILFKKADISGAQHCCIHCGKCAIACQMHLLPVYIAINAETENFEDCRRYGAMSCVECGACTFICPGKVPITQLIKIAKAKIRSIDAEKKKAEEKNGK